MTSHPLRARLARLGGLGVLGVAVLMLGASLASASVAVPLATAPLGAPHGGVGASSAPSFGHSLRPAGLPAYTSRSFAVQTPAATLAYARATSSVLSAYQAASHHFEKPVHAAQSTADNWYVSNWTFGAAIAPGGASSSDLAVALTDYWSDINGTSLAGYTNAPSATLFQSGITAVSTSSDGGVTWSGLDQLPLNASWVAPTNGSPCAGGSNLACGSVHVGSPVIAGNGAGHLLVADEYGQACYFFGSFGYCNSTVNITAPEGVAVDRSTNGGSNFAAPTVLASYRPVDWVGNLPQTTYCAAITDATLPGNTTFGQPALSYAPNGAATVVWSEEYYDFGQIFCNATAGQWEVNFTSAGQPYVYTWSSSSSNDGVSWSTPVSHGATQVAYVTTAIGPAPSYKQYIAFQDYNNATSSSVPIAIARSTNNGTTWTKSADGAGLGVNPVRGATPDNYPNFANAMSMAVDTGTSGTSHPGEIYLAWGDNGSSGNDPSVAFAYSGDGGALWSNSIYLTPITPSSTVYAIPEVAVGPSGDVWVTFYAVDATSGGLFEEGMYSANPTASSPTWVGPFAISDTEGLATNAPLVEFGAIQGLTVNSLGAFPTWDDCRNALCPTNGDHEAYVANLYPAGLTTNIGATDTVNVTVSALGAVSTIPVGASGASVVFETGSSVTVQVPYYEPGNSTSVYEFSNFSGLANSTNDPATFSYLGGGGALHANYIAVPASWIIGNVGPASAVRVSITSAALGTVTVPLTPYNATENSFNYSVPQGGPYTVRVTGGLYYVAFSTQVTTTALQATPVNVYLGKSSGWIAGTVTPTNATVTINGTAVTVGAGGLFNQSEPWGSYTVVAALAGFTNFSQGVNVNPYATSHVNPLLNGGQIVGTVSPFNATVELDGVALAVKQAGFNSGEIPGGPHLLTASAPGYSLYHRNIQVTAGGKVTLTIVLSNKGWITGSVAPATNATIQVNGIYQTISSATGNYNVTELAGHVYNVTASEKGGGYTPQSLGTLLVTAGNVSYANFSLVKTSGNGGCTVNCGGCTVNCGGNTGGHNTTGTSNNLLLYAGIGAVIVVVAAIAVLMLMRRRGGPPASSPAAEEPAPYDEGTGDGTNP